MGEVHSLVNVLNAIKEGRKQEMSRDDQVCMRVLRILDCHTQIHKYADN